MKYILIVIFPVIPIHPFDYPIEILKHTLKGLTLSVPTFLHSKQGQPL